MVMARAECACVISAVRDALHVICWEWGWGGEGEMEGGEGVEEGGNEKGLL